FGDHAVVYHYPCLVTAVDLRVNVTVEPITAQEISIETPALKETRQTRIVSLNELSGLQTYDAGTAFVTAAVQQLYQKFSLKQGLKITTAGPRISFGLGSSSAVTVATVYALAHLFNLNLEKQDLFDLAYAAVLAVQKVGSGFDVASAVYGGTIYYCASKSQPLPLMNYPLVIGYSGEKVSTTNLVNQVAALRERHPQVVEPIFQSIGQITEQARLALLVQDWPVLGELMNLHQGLLVSIGVSTLELEKLIYAARSSGAYGAKLSGAGGGDCMYALVNAARRADVETALTEAGGTLVPFQSNAEGARVETVM
ncbi:MAG: mevalonate kinase, partial [Anaerolineae bacterium]|nr:mevalonate kinase [Anaerolineae bacterium]